MSDNNNIIWNDLIPTFEQTEEIYFETWDKFERKFGEFGTAGFTEQTHPAKSNLFGHHNYVDVRYTLYRNDSGKLLFIHGCYIDENGLQKPFIWNVHPDYQRQGLATMMADYVIERYKNENNSDYTYEQSLRDTKYNEASANFTNKYVKNVHGQ